MKETTVQIDGMMSIFDDAGIEKQIKRRNGVVRVDANFLNGTATIVYDETRVALDDIKAFIADCGYHGARLRAGQAKWDADHPSARASGSGRAALSDTVCCQISWGENQSRSFSDAAGCQTARGKGED